MVKVTVAYVYYILFAVSVRVKFVFQTAKINEKPAG
jgi:hypothetical protein